MATPRARVFPIVLVSLVTVACLQATEVPQPAPPADTDLQSFAGDPVFEPDYNHLTPYPWVQPATPKQTEEATVSGDRLVFPRVGNDDILTWEPGRVVVGGPGANARTHNPFGFARRVLSVQVEGDTIVVMTESLRLEDVVQGDFQIAVQPDQAKTADLSNVDLNDVISALYQDPDVIAVPDDELVDDAPDPNDPYEGVTTETFGPAEGMQPQSLKSFWNKVKKGANEVGRAIGGAAKAVAQKAKDVWVSVTPSHFKGDVNINRELSYEYSSQLFELSYAKAFRSKSKTPFEIFISGKGDLTKASLAFNPGFQLGAKIPVPGHDASPEYWMNIDSRLKVELALDFTVETGIRSIDDQPVSSQQAYDLGQKGAEALSAAREKILGDPDMKPVGGWKRTLYISQPRVYTFSAGPVPVVITNTVQVDLECGFELKAQLNAHVSFRQDARFKYSVNYDGGSRKVTSTGPTFSQDRKFDASVTGGGSAVVSCGLIPRVNVFAYDTLGIFAGLRGSLVARASYDEQCKQDPTNSRPDGTVKLGLAANVGIQVGARIQAPGSSFFGKAGQKAGTDIGPFEPWNKEWELFSKSWTFPGLGYCLPLCKNLAKEPAESDVDCGGPCSQCAIGKSCRKNSDCARGFCSGGRCGSNSCTDGVRDNGESDVDCGGSCSKCVDGKECRSGADCASGFCALPANGSGFKIGTCTSNHCSDGVLDADEAGVDCGGRDCPKCGNGVASSAPEACDSGFWSGGYCVANACRDGKQSPGEGGVDCGGVCSAKCQNGQSCSKDADCSASAPVCDASKRCAPEPASCHDGAKSAGEGDVDCGAACKKKCNVEQGCNVDADCATGQCNANVKSCVQDSCVNGRLDATETDIDCGGTCPSACATGQKCKVDRDCTAPAACVAGACQ
jgi:hypothetical protein